MLYMLSYGCHFFIKMQNFDKLFDMIMPFIEDKQNSEYILIIIGVAEGLKKYLKNEKFVKSLFFNE